MDAPEPREAFPLLAVVVIVAILVLTAIAVYLYRQPPEVLEETTPSGLVC